MKIKPLTWILDESHMHQSLRASTVFGEYVVGRQKLIVNGAWGDWGEWSWYFDPLFGSGDLDRGEVGVKDESHGIQQAEENWIENVKSCLDEL